MSNLLDTLNEILLGKVSHDSGIPEHALMNSQKFKEYWEEFCETTEDTWSLRHVVDYVFDLDFDGEFGNNLQ